MIYDYAVVGAGVVGLATAYHIKRLKPTARIIIVDRFPGPGMGDTAKAIVGFRTAFTATIGRLLAKSSVEFYRSQQMAGIDLGMRWVGYLFLVPERRREDMISTVKELREKGSRIDVLSDLRLPIRFKVTEDEEAREMGLEDIAFAVLVRDAGVMDQQKLVRFYHEEYLKMGGETLYNAEVRSIVFKPKKPLGVPSEPFPWQDVEVQGLETTRGVIEAKNVILATGAWSEGLLSSMGFGLPLKPRKKHVFAVRALGELKDLLYSDLTGGGAMPMIILPWGIYVRPVPEENSFWILESYRGPYGLEADPKPDEKLWRFGVYPILTKYIPPFEGSSPHSAWAGHYDENIVDYQPIVDRLAPGLYIAAGTSGFGVMRADAIGRIAASLALNLPKAELYGGVEVPSDFLRFYRHFEIDRLLVIVGPSSWG